MRLNRSLSFFPIAAVWILALLFAGHTSHGVYAGPGASVTFTENTAQTQPWIFPAVDYNSRSAALADIDNDGDLDILIQHQSGSALFRNDLIGLGTSGHTDVTSTQFRGNNSESRWSTAWADIDGDGDIDFFSGQVNSGSRVGDFLRNDGSGGFDDATFEVGLTDPGFHQNVGWADMNNDRRLDLVLAMEGPEQHEIYLQQEDGTFIAVGASVGIQVPYGTKAYGTAIGDADGDGDLDFYISTCISGGNIRNNFFENNLIPSGTFSFTDIADTNNTQYMPNSYGSQFVDFDDDGDLDLYMTGADSQASKLWRNDGGNQFTDTDTLRGAPLLSDVARDLNGSRAIDYDNDGDLDLWFHDHGKFSNPGTDTIGLLYRNDGNWNFTDVTSTVGLQRSNAGAYDSTWGDLDLDGDLDLVLPTGTGDNELLFFSDANTNGNNWLYVRLAGEEWNTRGVGATLYATINKGTPQERTLRREANANAGTFNQSDLPVHFGLGTATQVDEMRVIWPGGIEQQETSYAPNQYITITFRQPTAFNSRLEVY